MMERDGEEPHNTGVPFHYHEDMTKHYQQSLFSIKWPFGREYVALQDAPVIRFRNGTIDWGTVGNRPRSKPAEFYQTFEQIVTGAGFLFEEHKVITADGYILSVFHIKS